LRRTAPQGILARLLSIPRRSSIVPPALKVYRQLCRDLARALAIGRLFPLPNQGVKLHPSCFSHLFVQDVLVQPMAKSVAPTHGSVWPLCESRRPYEMTLLGQSFAPCFDGLSVFFDTCRHRGG
jgi:hypothetical protein